MWNPIFEEYGYTFDEEWTHYGEDIGNCSVTILKYKDGNYTMEVVGDTSYREG